MPALVEPTPNMLSVAKILNTSLEACVSTRCIIMIFELLYEEV